MNKFYRVVFNHATQTWTAVAEYAKAKGKTKSIKVATIATAIAAASAGVGTAQAAKIDGRMLGRQVADKVIYISDNNAQPNTEHLGRVDNPEGKSIFIGNSSYHGGILREGNIVIGYDTNNRATGNGGDIAIGNNISLGGGGQDSQATVVGHYAQGVGPVVVIGNQARADLYNWNGAADMAHGAVAIGPQAFAGGNLNGVTAVGAGASSSSSNSVSLGLYAGQFGNDHFFDDLVHQTFTSFGERAGNAAISVGPWSSAKGHRAIAIGADARTGANFAGNSDAQRSTGSHQAISIGQNAVAVTEKSVVLGSGSQAGQYTDEQIENLRERLVKAEEQYKKFEQKVADAGESWKQGNFTVQSQYALDVANKERAKLVRDRLKKDIDSVKEQVSDDDTSQAIAIGYVSKALARNSIAIGASDKVSGTQSNAIGTSNEVSGTQSTAIGYHNTVNTDGSVAIGENVTVVLDSHQSIVIGQNSSANHASSIVLGVNSKTEGKGANLIAIGHDAIANATEDNYTAIAIGANTRAKGKNSIAMGIGSYTTHDGSLAIGTGYAKSEGVGTVAIGNTVLAKGNAATAIGTGSQASKNSSIAIGGESYASGDSAVSIGWGGRSGALATVVVGREGQASGESAVAVGHLSKAAGIGSVSVGRRTVSDGESSLAAGRFAVANGGNFVTAVGGVSKATAVQASAFGAAANAKGEYSTALGSQSNAKAQASIAAGLNSLATGNNAIAIGSALHTDRVIKTDGEGEQIIVAEDGFSRTAATGTNAVAIGHGSQARGENAIAIGVGNLVTGSNSGAFGDPNHISGQGSYVFGNNNTVNTDDTFVLGNSVGKDDAGENLSGSTIANSVYLGKDSEANATALTDATTTSAGTQQVDKERAAGATQTAGVGEYKGSTFTNTGFVNSTATSGYALAERADKFTYAQADDPTAKQASNYAGKDAVGVVTVGAAGNERRIVNVAAGLVSDKSTDAVNGSQLYAVMKQAAQPIIFTGNKNADTDNNGTEQILGTSLRITGATADFAGVRDTSGVRTAGRFDAKNVATVVSNGEVQIQIAKNPEFETVNLATSVLPTFEVYANNAPTTNLTKAASVGDVLKTGFNLKANDVAKDFVKPYDTVVFADGRGTTAYIETSEAGLVSTIKYDAAVDNKTIIVNRDGKLATTAVTPSNYFHVNDTHKTLTPISTNHDTVDGTGGAAGAKALAAGVYAQALGENAIAVGHNAVTKTGAANAQQSSNSIAMGTNAIVNGQKSVAIGFRAEVSADNYNEASGIALGDEAAVRGKNSIALGHRAKTRVAGQGSAMAIGDQAETTNQYAAAIGTRAKAQGYGSTAIAYKAKALSQNAVALGESATAGKRGGYAEIAIGNRANAIGDRSLAVGLDANSQGASAIAIGQLSKTTDKAAQSTAIGYNASTELARSLALGNKANAKGVDSTAIGTTATANDTSGYAIGVRANSTGTNSFAVGTGATTNAANTVAIGTESKANTTFGVAMGYQAQAGDLANAGYRSTAIGHTAKALANDAIAIGTNSQATDVAAISIGRNTVNAGGGSVAIGDAVKISDTADRTVVLGREIDTLTKSDNVILGSRASEYSATINNDSYDASGQIKDKINQATIGDITYGGFAGERAAGVVSIGRDKADHVYGDGLDGERRLINVAAGEISARSTDAINGSQIYSVLQNGSWKLQENATDKDDVKFGDKVNFVDGANTQVTIATNLDKNSSDIKVNVIGLPVSYTTKDGKPVAKVGDEYYVLDENGNPTDQKIEKDNIVVNAINPSAKPNAIGNPISISNVQSGLDINHVAINPIATAGSTAPLLNLANASVVDSTVATVGDLRNMGWVVSASGNRYNDVVKNANEVKFIGEQGIIVNGETKDNVREITIKGTLFETKETDDGYIITITQPDGSQKELNIKNGKDGINGKNGTSVVATVNDDGTITVSNIDADGIKTDVGKLTNGKDGDKGDQGEQGIQGLKGDK
ncbi:ESPR-type extended signal peptide-containing protein, partial [Moraxella sp.]|uniref:ESPR-type extended signal peptide-containing protein n=1 Tax=Moraxella sp. TaxID=479 RepID=UPI0026DD8739